MSPTQRSLAWLREIGWTAQVVEKWNAHAKVRQDLFGVIDIVAIAAAVSNTRRVQPDPHPCILGVQACADSSHSKRLDKALLEPRLRVWLEAGGAFEVQSWGKRGPKGKAKRWQIRRTAVVLEPSGSLAPASLVVVPLPVAE